jgi:hypothetical protein
LIDGLTKGRIIKMESEKPKTIKLENINVIGVTAMGFEGTDGFGYVLDDGEVYSEAALLSMRERARRRDQGWEGPNL